jgi:hypothetical protein
MADAHRDDGKRFVVRADETLTAFVEHESAIRRRAPSKSQSASLYQDTRSGGYKERVSLQPYNPCFAVTWQLDRLVPATPATRFPMSQGETLDVRR